MRTGLVVECFGGDAARVVLIVPYPRLMLRVTGRGLMFPGVRWIEVAWEGDAFAGQVGQHEALASSTGLWKKLWKSGDKRRF
jgi:hypothetical protein